MSKLVSAFFMVLSTIVIALPFILKMPRNNFTNLVLILGLIVFVGSVLAPMYELPKLGKEKEE